MLIIKKAGISNTPQSERRFLNSKARSYKVRMKNRDERTRVATGPRRSVAILRKVAGAAPNAELLDPTA
jgi:hypothetical protein